MFKLIGYFGDFSQISRISASQATFQLDISLAECHASSQKKLTRGFRICGGKERKRERERGGGLLAGRETMKTRADRIVNFAVATGLCDRVAVLHI